MVNFLFSFFSKDYCPSFKVGEPMIKEFILPYENIKYGNFVKGSFYIRKTIYTYKFRNPLLGKIKKAKYSGLLYVIAEEPNGWKEEKNIVLTPDFYSSDDDFLEHAYLKYQI